MKLLSGDMNYLKNKSKNRKNKKGLRQWAKLQDVGEGLWLWLFQGENKDQSYFVGFAQNPTS